MSNHSHAVKPEVFRALMNLSRFWEARKLLELTVSSAVGPQDALRTFQEFFYQTKSYLSNQAAKLAQLSALIQYLDFIYHSRKKYDDLTIEKVFESHAEQILKMPQQEIDEAEELLVYFFDDIGSAKGLLFDRWIERAIYFTDLERDRMVAESIFSSDVEAKLAGRAADIKKSIQNLSQDSKGKLVSQKVESYKYADGPQIYQDLKSEVKRLKKD